MSLEEVVDLVRIPKPPPSHPRPGELGEEIRGDLRRRLDATQVEYRFKFAQVRHDPIIAHVPVLRHVVRPPVPRMGVGVQGSCIMSILASQVIQITPAHVDMAPTPIVATSTSQNGERSVASALGVDGFQGSWILQLLDSRGTIIEAKLALSREREVFDTYML